MPKIEFDKAAHQYKADGIKVPSVTQIIKESGLIDTRWCKPIHLERGQYVHSILEYIDQDDIDMTTVDPGLLGYVAAWEKFKRESAWKILGVEVDVYHDVWRYAGRVDRLVDTGDGFLAVLDIKSGDVQPWVGLQTAAYAEGIKRFSESKMSAKRYALSVASDGTYKLTQFSDGKDWPAFLAALSLYNWKAANGLLSKQQEVAADGHIE